MTFDDGHASHYAMAFPELRRRHMTATFFVTTDWVGTPGYVTWQQLRDMRAAGMSVQSHTVSHPALSELSHVEVRQELGESKRRLDDELGQQTTTIALPGGDFPRRWRAQDFAACGYRWIATSWWGPNHLRRDAEVLTVRRYTVRRSTSARRFDRLVLGSSPAVSLEGVRLTILSQMRSLVGAHRYTTWRQAFLRDYQP